MKRYCRLLVLMVLFTGLMGAGRCGKDAKLKIESAKEAVSEARRAEAPTYAPDEFRSAEDALLQAQEQYDRFRFGRAEESAVTAEREARLAKELALEARAREDIRMERAQEERRAEELAYNVSSVFGDTALQEVPPEEQAGMALHDVHFPFDSSLLNEAANGLLALNAEWLKDHPSVKVEIEGHCDERGTEEYNLALGARRAETVYDFLVDYGIDPKRLRTISYGESVPLDPGHDEQAWAKNRRVHFAVIQ